jgi:hypothetical protein
MEGTNMPMYITIGYGDVEGYARTAAPVRDSAHRHDAQLEDRGALIGVAGPPLQVRNHDAADLRVSEGAYMHSDLPLAGFAVIEAEDLEEAARLVSETPCAVAHGVVEIWPLHRHEPDPAAAG